MHWFWLLNFDVPRFGGLIGGIIEQGPRLESQEQKIGVVRGVSREPVSKIANQPIDSLHVKVQAYRWHTVTVIGRECHTGTTDFANRSEYVFLDRLKQMFYDLDIFQDLRYSLKFGNTDSKILNQCDAHGSENDTSLSSTGNEVLLFGKYWDADPEPWKHEHCAWNCSFFS